MTAIWWIRRDLRLEDNPALMAAMQTGEQVIPVFVIDPALMEGAAPPKKRLAFLWEGLRALEVDLRARGSQLIVRRGDPAVELTKLAQESQAGAIFAQADVTPLARRREAAVAENLPLHLTAGLTAHAVGSITKADGSPYTVYTPFSKAWKALPRVEMGARLMVPQKIHTPAGLASLPIPPAEAKISFVAGEAAAHRRLAEFIEGIDAPIFRYAAERNRPDLSGTSGLSPYLRFGMLSARTAVRAAQEALQRAAHTEARKGAETWLNELIWREFYISILHHHPHVLRESFRPELRAITWINRPDDFEAWKAGQTGYPIVDAAMRQLAQTGWMHNRARMIVASFLVKDLLIDWRWGERWFMEQLVDGDPAANNGGWQWTAGTGTDAAPYFRVFNPVLQGFKFDPQGHFVRRWVPELASVPEKYLHAPWEMPESLQIRVGVRLGREYPHPIVDHSFARERTLAAYQQAKAIKELQ